MGRMKDSTLLDRAANALGGKSALALDVRALARKLDAREHRERGLERCESCGKWISYATMRSDGECDFCPKCWAEWLVSDHPPMLECRDCDGCGWVEGGNPLQTNCAKCGGTGFVPVQYPRPSLGAPER